MTLTKIGLVACSFLSFTAYAVQPSDVIQHYADMAAAKYADSLMTAKILDSAIDDLLAKPSEQSLAAAKTAWRQARVPYQQTEVYRFGNPIVDDWEGRVNAWPLDEGLIDYVTAGYGTENAENTLYTANVIANSKLMIDGKPVDASDITPDFLANQLHEAGGIEANVATGYHAIEFLLWGQDLNGTQAGAGQRPYTDYSLEECTHAPCERRREYLATASDLLVTDLEEMTANWQEGGKARQALLQGTTASGLSTILSGMGSLSYGELAGERMKLGLLLGDPEEEHDCFSDNTHYSHYYNAAGIQNVYLGSYSRPDGSRLVGPSLSDLVAAKDASVDAELQAKLAASLDAMTNLIKRAKTKEAYDQMIAHGNQEGNKVVNQAIQALLEQTLAIENAIKTLDLAQIDLEGSDSLDNPGAVFQ